MHWTVNDPRGLILDIINSNMISKLSTKQTKGVFLNYKTEIVFVFFFRFDVFVECL